MRSFIAGTAVFLAFLTGTATLCSLVVQQVVLDPERVEQILEDALDDGDLAAKVLGRIVPGYTSLGTKERTAVDKVTKDPQVREAVAAITFEADTGEINLQPLKDGLVGRLRAEDQQALAKRVDQDPRDTVVNVPSDVMDRYRDAADLTSTSIFVGVLATVLFAALAFVSSKARVQTCRSLGIAAVLSGAAVGALYWVLPGAARGLSSSDAAQFGALLLEAGRPTVLWIVLPVILVGIAVILSATIASRATRHL